MKPAILFALLLGACASHPQVWDRPDLTQAEFSKDDYACRRDNINTGGGTYTVTGWVNGRSVDPAMYRRCMQASGYSLRPKG